MKIPYFMPIAVSLLLGLLIVLIGVAFWQLTYKPEPVKAKSISADVLWTIVNDYRVSKGLQPFEKSETLCEIARDRINDGWDAHKGFNEKYYYYSSQLSENMAYGNSEEELLNNWLNSTPHREALEKDWKYSCIASRDDYAVQIFSNLENQ